ncbi:MAG: hypothetical protein AW06_003070 [Candidatus Accumulibacter cognatus]|uniref:Uncharacterized protein n=1 Tax=Candidatus Accumulibacter cognatus TaxID=2954383 RepID=A0A080M3W7_9PROT|nr:MAG: hypothetical protein AW06_003070 [Candidatus Accumulibacter cognatus]
MDDDHDPSECVLAQRDEALFSLCVRILDGDSHRVTEGLFGMGEADLGLARLDLALDGSNSMSIEALCISSIGWIGLVTGG